MKYSELGNNIENFINSLKKSDTSYLPVLSGYTKNGEKISLGLTCYALKTLYTVNSSVLDNKITKDKYVKFIESFSVKQDIFPNYSFVDTSYLKAYKQNMFFIYTKNVVKLILKRIKYHEVSSSIKLKEFINAETKQAISTLNQLGVDYTKFTDGFPTDESSIKKFNDDLDWSKPWNAGAQLSGICIFNSYLHDSEKVAKIINDILQELINKDGAYYLGQNISSSEKINGAMKVITGMDWLNLRIHKPKELIDTCLNHIPNSEGCDLVDVVYVLYKCNQLTKYKEDDIKIYLERLIPIIMSHYFPEYGGFSYFKNKSQTHYYGVQITNGHNTPDIHGTTLLVWALSMIFKILGENYPNWSVIRP